MKRIYRDQRFRNHPKNRKKALRADKKLRTIAGRLVRELKRNLGEHLGYTELIERFEAILAQRRHSGKKIYSIHEPQVQCISKGKEHKKYEFGNKVSIIRSATGIILGAQSFRNEREFDIKEWHNTLVISVFYFPHNVFQVLILLSDGFLSTSEAQ
ncbi:hypothetical protein Pgin02_01877 [Porphyromonas gingivalis]